jgi:lipopolysaccharide transport system permease protein
MQAPGTEQLAMNRTRGVPEVQRLIYLRDLLRELVVRELKVRYKRSVLGFAWALVTPLLFLSVFYFVFKVALSLDIPRFGPYAFIGMLVYSWFQSSLSQASGAITNNAELIKWPGFTAAVLPAVTVTANLVHFLFALPLLMLFLVFDGTGLGAMVLLLPVVIGVQFALTLGLAWLVAAGNALFRDIKHLVGVLLQLLFFLTPVFYHADMVPERYQSLYRLNPMVHLLEAYRGMLLEGIWPDGTTLLGLGVFAASLLWFGYRVFTRVNYRFVEEI